MRARSLSLTGLVLLILVSLSGCLEGAPPDWALRLTPTAVPRPPTTPITPYHLRPIDPASIQAGRWQWRSFTTSAEAYPPVQLWFDVAEGGAVEGMLSIYPDYPEIPEASRTLIQQNGCNVAIESLGAAPGEAIDPRLFTSMVARVAIDVRECTVKYYGPVTLAEPLVGQFIVAYDAAMTEELIRAANEPPTPLARGRNVFIRYCSACHGSYGEGMPGIPALASDQVRGYSDDQILTIMRSGVLNTTMPAWGNVLSEDDILGTLAFIRQIDTLETGG